MEIGDCRGRLEMVRFISWIENTSFVWLRFIAMNKVGYIQQGFESKLWSW